MRETKTRVVSANAASRPVCREIIVYEDALININRVHVVDICSKVNVGSIERGAMHTEKCSAQTERRN